MSPDLIEHLRVFLNHLWLGATHTGIFTTLTGVFRCHTSYFREKPLFSLPGLSYSILSHHLSVYLFPSCIRGGFMSMYGKTNTVL